MNALTLPGLRATEPIGFLAAVGLLRVCDLRADFGRTFLSWDSSGDSTAVLWTERNVKPDGLTRELLLPWMSDRWQHRLFGSGEPGVRDDRDEEGSAAVPSVEMSASKADRNRGKALRWDNDIKVARETFADELRAARSTACLDRRDYTDGLVGYGTDGVEVKSSTRGMVVATTALCMTAGNQALLKLLRELAFSLDAGVEWGRRLGKEKIAHLSPEKTFESALFAPWDFTPGQVRDGGYLSLGWDAQSYYIAALRGERTPNTTPPRAAVWLAAEALSVFPCVPVRSGRVQTRGFDARGKLFRWPVWSNPLTIRAVRTAVGSVALYRERIDRRELRSLGIRQVYGCGVIALTDYPCFRPAIVLADVGGELEAEFQ